MLFHSCFFSFMIICRLRFLFYLKSFTNPKFTCSLQFLCFYFLIFLLRRNLKLPSRQPSIVCESCLYSLEKDMRVRAFQIMDPKGVSEMLLIFLEERGDAVLLPPSLDNLVSFTKKVTLKPLYLLETEYIESL